MSLVVLERQRDQLVHRPGEHDQEDGDTRQHERVRLAPVPGRVRHGDDVGDRVRCLDLVRGDRHGLFLVLCHCARHVRDLTRAWSPPARRREDPRAVLLGVEDLRDFLGRGLGRVGDGGLARQDVDEHVRDRLRGLDVRPVDGGRDEPRLARPARTAAMPGTSDSSEVVFGRTPLAASAFWLSVEVKSAIHSAASAALADLAGTVRTEPPRKVGMTSPAVTLGIG